MALTAEAAAVLAGDQLYAVCEDLLASARRRGALQELAAISVFRASASCDRGARAKLFTTFWTVANDARAWGA